MDDIPPNLLLDEPDHIPLLFESTVTGYYRKHHIPLSANPNGRKTIVFSITVTAISILVLASRLYTRAAIVRLFGWDDFLMAAAAAVVIPSLVILIVYIKEYGIGLPQHLADPSSIIEIRKFSFFNPLLHNFGLTLTRASLLLTVLRFARGVTNKFYIRLVNIVILFELVFLIVSSFTMGLGCTAQKPSLAYTGTPEEKEKCITGRMTYMCIFIIGIVANFLVLAVPTPFLCWMHLDWRRKAELLSLFILGGASCLAGVIKIIKIANAMEANDFWDYEAHIWGMAEINLGIICGSLPALKSLHAHLSLNLGGRKSCYNPHNSHCRSHPNDVPGCSQMPTISAKGNGNIVEHTLHRNDDAEEGLGSHEDDSGALSSRSLMVTSSNQSTTTGDHLPRRHSRGTTHHDDYQDLHVEFADVGGLAASGTGGIPRGDGKMKMPKDGGSSDVGAGDGIMKPSAKVFGWRGPGCLRGFSLERLRASRAIRTLSRITGGSSSSGTANGGGDCNELVEQPKPDSWDGSLRPFAISSASPSSSTSPQQHGEAQTMFGITKRLPSISSSRNVNRQIEPAVVDDWPWGLCGEECTSQNGGELGGKGMCACMERILLNRRRQEEAERRKMQSQSARNDTGYR